MKSGLKTRKLPPVEGVEAGVACLLRHERERVRASSKSAWAHLNLFGAAEAGGSSGTDAAAPGDTAPSFAFGF